MSKRKGLPDERGMRHSHHFVEELFNRDDDPVGRQLPLSSLEVNPDQPRTSIGEVEELAQSIRSHGILEPLLVHRLENDKYMIIAGERRYHAAMKAGLSIVPCVEIDIINESEILEIALIENLQRLNLDPFEEAQGYLTLKEKYDHTHEKIAKIVGKSRTTISELLTLIKIPEEIRLLCRHADISAKSILLEIAKAENILEMRKLVDLYAAGADRQSLRDHRHSLDDPEEGGTPDRDKDPNEQVSRPKPFIFKVTPTEGHFSLSLRFKQENVSKEEIIDTLSAIIKQLKEESEHHQPPLT